MLGGFGCVGGGRTMSVDRSGTHSRRVTRASSGKQFAAVLGRTLHHSLYIESLHCRDGQGRGITLEKVTSGGHRLWRAHDYHFWKSRQPWEVDLRRDRQI